MSQAEGQLEHLIGYRLKQAQAVLRARMDESLRPLGLTTPQYSCLEAIDRHPGGSNSDIARSVFVTRQTMNTLLRGLQQRGLVQRAERANAGRAIPTTLTEEGRRLLAEASGRAAGINQAMTDALGPDLADALALGLSRCIDTLEEMPDLTGS
ncbi:MarR family winged helix-turn-helix transcriptional regulator [Nocardiopsis composta]|uniref:DNA-binding MarR family transcriptional regulator n=1 Tax=Nocardiopsis composta TaxID=157465 RepID=A0A7W8VG90_9ACTN|nr:MarR family transcriptional regulator [Nocardiopsis composta]MBB5434754.1 DNA-binding MarR family transcriptional regulator [Nocardiopsis composta]